MSHVYLLAEVINATKLFSLCIIFVTNFVQLPRAIPSWCNYDPFCAFQCYISLCGWWYFLSPLVNGLLACEVRIGPWGIHCNFTHEFRLYKSS